jgi:hypothetical protein
LFLGTFCGQSIGESQQRLLAIFCLLITIADFVKLDGLERLEKVGQLIKKSIRRRITPLTTDIPCAE